MKTVTEIINIINDAKIAAPCYLEDIVDMEAEGIKEVATIDHDEYRWYTCGTVVYKIGDSFFGIFGPVSLKEESSYSDLGWECEAFEMEQVPSVTYKAKKV